MSHVLFIPLGKIITTLIHIYNYRNKWYSFVKCSIENKAVDISSLEVVPFMLVISLSKEQA